MYRITSFLAVVALFAIQPSFAFSAALQDDVEKDSVKAKAESVVQESLSEEKNDGEHHAEHASEESAELESVHEDSEAGEHAAPVAMDSEDCCQETVSVPAAMYVPDCGPVRVEYSSYRDPSRCLFRRVNVTTEYYATANGMMARTVTRRGLFGRSETWCVVAEEMPVTMEPAVVPTPVENAEEEGAEEEGAEEEGAEEEGDAKAEEHSAAAEDGEAVEEKPGDKEASKEKSEHESKDESGK